MTSAKNRERILEAIDQLRRRKARPDVQRICNYLFRKFSVNSAEARTDLQWCVDNDVVLKVEYKGSTSYRNAAKKFSHLKRPEEALAGGGGGGAVAAASDAGKAGRKFAQLLTNAFGELIVQDPDYLELGVPADDIIENILSKDSVRYTRKYISILLDKEVETGGLIRMHNGNYEMGPAADDEGGGRSRVEPRRSREDPRRADEHRRSEEERRVETSSADAVFATKARKEFPTIHVKPRKKPGPKPGFRRERQLESLGGGGDNSMDSDERKSESGSLRVGGRRKRAKKVFDPSDHHIPKKRGRPAGSLNKSTIEKQLAKLSDESRPESRTSNSGREQGGVCSVCHLQNKRGPNESMVACRECSNKAHYSCLNGDDMMLRLYPDNTWQCPHCKTCVTCYETSDAGGLVVCSVCADAYHAGCHQPRITEKIRNGMKWLCINCQMPKELEINDIQSNIGNTFRKLPSSAVQSSTSGSRNSSPTNYRSLPNSPLPPQLSPQRETDGAHQRTPSPDGNMSDSQDKDSDLDENIDPSIPDASNWTYEEVYQYFAQYFPNEARVFREQEIDGRSLLLLKRLDVLKNLKLKLGPALKIYKHVVKLQVRRDDPKLYWL